jgi:hypothetical protein
MSRGVTIRRDRRRTGRIYCSLVPPMLERIVKKSLAGLALAVVTVATLAVPAGAATPTTWTHQTLHCAGRKTATVTYKWQGGAIVNSWVDNRCGHQWVNLVSCMDHGGGDGETTICGQYDVWPRSKANLGGMNADATAALMLGSMCDSSEGPVDSCQA